MLRPATGRGGRGGRGTLTLAPIPTQTRTHTLTLTHTHTLNPNPNPNPNPNQVDVALERSLQILDPCYISLISQRTLRLYNRSDIRVQFEWKQLASEGHEAS